MHLNLNLYQPRRRPGGEPQWTREGGLPVPPAQNLLKRARPTSGDGGATSAPDTSSPTSPTTTTGTPTSPTTQSSPTTTSSSPTTAQNPTTSPTTATTTTRGPTSPTTATTPTATPTTSPTQTITTTLPNGSTTTTITGGTNGSNDPSGTTNPAGPQSTSTMSITTVMTLSSSNKPSTGSNGLPLPTKLQSPTSISSGQSHAIIAGSASGFVLLLLLLLGGIFYLRRRKHKKFEFLNALAAPTQKEHSRAMLLAGEDMDDYGGVGGGRGGSMRESAGRESIGLGHVRAGDSFGAGASNSYRDLSYPPPATPWDSGDPRSSIEALHHPSRTPPSEATQYMTQYLMRARGSETGSMFHEGVWPPPGEGATLVDPILRSSSEVDLTGIVDSVMGPSREGSPTHGVGVGAGAGWGNHSRNVSAISSTHAPLLPPPPPPAVTISSPSPTLSSIRTTAAPVRSSPLKGAAVVRSGGSGSGSGSGEEDKMARTKNWIERSLAR